MRLLFSIWICHCFIVKVVSEDDFYFGLSPQSQTVKMGENIRLRCRVSSHDHVVYAWTLNGDVINNTTRRFQEDSDLVIRRVDRSMDSGPFVCTATNISSGYSVASLPATLTILWISNTSRVVPQSDLSADSQAISKVSVAYGDNITLRCAVEGSGDILFEWFHNGKKIQKAKSRKFNLTKVTSSDSGTYMCTARNSAANSKVNVPIIISVRVSNVPELLSFIKDQIAVAATSVQLPCTFDPPTKVEWVFENKKLSNSSRYTIADDGQLTVFDIDEDAQGWYKCIAAHGEVVQEYGARIMLAYIHNFKKTSIDPASADGLFYVAEYSLLQLTCVAPEGIPTPSIWWEGRNNQKLTIPSTSQESVLSITRIRLEDTGLYICNAENLAKKHQIGINVVVTSLPVILQHPASLSLSEGEEAIFTCSFIGSTYPASRIKWLKDSVPIPNNILAVQGSRNSTLRFVATLNHIGNYSCTIETFGHSRVVSHNATLLVRETLKFSPMSVNKKLELGSLSKVHCKAQGQPTPLVRWVKEGQPLLSWPAHIEDINGTLYFHGVQTQDSGLYTCVATNSQGLINTTIRIDVVVLPHFTSLPDNTTTVQEGKDVELHCQAKGEPHPTIQWDKDSVLNAIPNDRFVTFPNGTLLIQNIRLEDEGYYGCTAGNAGGFKRVEIQLIVQGKDKDSDNDGEPITKTVAITLGAAAAYILLSIALLIWCRFKRRKHKMHSDINNMNLTANTVEAALLTKQEQQESDSGNSSTMITRDKTIFPVNAITYVAVIGKGRFGDVSEGLVRDHSSTEQSRRVILRSFATREEELITEFKRQADIFNRVAHANLASVIGFCKESEPSLLLIDFNHHTILKTFLLSVTESTSKYTLWSISLQIAQGMTALADAKIVHRDLGTRNILIDICSKDRVSVKISSLGMDKHPFASDYWCCNNKVIALRWLPREAVLDDEYSTKSDIWMFACTVWELYNGAQLPFSSRSDERVYKDLSSRTLCWQSPLSKSNNISETLLNCWSYDPILRPSFNDVLDCIKSSTDHI